MYKNTIQSTLPRCELFSNHYIDFIVDLFEKPDKSTNVRTRVIAFYGYDRNLNPFTLF